MSLTVNVIRNPLHPQMKNALHLQPGEAGVNPENGEVWIKTGDNTPLFIRAQPRTNTVSLGIPGSYPVDTSYNITLNVEISK